ncbi:MAG: hypothetical protein WBM92_03820, partial [Aureibaculum sp.]
MKNLSLLSIFILFIAIGCKTNSDKKSEIAINVSFSEDIIKEDLDGRLLLMLSNNDEEEPRFQIGMGFQHQLVYGMDVNKLAPGKKVTFNESIFGFPFESLKDISPGDYYVQALLHIYDTFNLSTGQTVKLPMDQGEGQKWNRSPGNLYSKPFKITVTENGIENFDIVLDQMIPEIKA